MPLDRSPVAAAQDVEEQADMTVGMATFIRDHGSGALSDAYYTSLVKASADYLRPLLG